MSEAMNERRALKDRVLEAALAHAAFDGWSRRTLVNGARDAGVDQPTADRLFPRGGDGLLEWLDDWADRRMLEAAGDAGDGGGFSVRRRIAGLIRARLEALADHREALRRAALARALPNNAAATGRSVWRTVDRMWEAAGLGDGSARRGLDYYSRRATLAAVLVATFLFWLEDQSDDFADTWAFVDRRIQDVMRVGQLRERLGSVLGRRPWSPGAAQR